MSDQFLIVISDNAGMHKATKILFYSDGGFAVLTPYHNANTGLVQKLIHNSKTGRFLVECNQEYMYTVENQAKLSYHPSGLVQFSGNNIVSGLDAKTRKPKGVAIQIKPFPYIIRSGPTFGVSLWGKSDFKQYITQKKKEISIVFNEEDYNYRNCNENDWNGYIIEGFLWDRNPNWFKTQKTRL